MTPPLLLLSSSFSASPSDCVTNRLARYLDFRTSPPPLLSPPSFLSLPYVSGEVNTAQNATFEVSAQAVPVRTVRPRGIGTAFQM